MAKKLIDMTTTPEELDKQEAAQAASIEAAATPEEKTAKKAAKAKKGPKKVHGHNYAEARKAIDKTVSLSVEDAVKILRKTAYAKFNESVELHINLGIDKT